MPRARSHRPPRHIQDAADLMTGSPGAGLTESSSGSWVRERGELTYVYDIECRNARDQVIEPCDARTRSADVSVRVEGRFDSARRSSTLVRTGEWSLVLDGAAIVADGSVTVDQASTFEALNRNASRSYDLVVTADAMGLRFDLESKRMVGGSISYAIEAQRTRSNRFEEVVASFEVEAEVSFGSEGPALVIVDGSRSYEADRNTTEVQSS